MRSTFSVAGHFLCLSRGYCLVIAMRGCGSGIAQQVNDLDGSAITRLTLRPREAGADLML